MSKFKLWEHQKKAVKSKNEYSKCLIKMWCGTGKTRIFTHSIFDYKFN